MATPTPARKSAKIIPFPRPFRQRSEQSIRDEIKALLTECFLEAESEAQAQAILKGEPT